MRARYVLEETGRKAPDHLVYLNIVPRHSLLKGGGGLGLGQVRSGHLSKQFYREEDSGFQCSTTIYNLLSSTTRTSGDVGMIQHVALSNGKLRLSVVLQ